MTNKANDRRIRFREIENPLVITDPLARLYNHSADDIQIAAVDFEILG